MKNLYSNTFENDYLKNSSPTYRKKLGQFFTPFPIAYFMSEWLLSGSKKTISLLDPAAGFGIFSRAIEKLIKEKKNNLKVKHHLKEIDKDVSEKLSGILSPFTDRVYIRTEDFLKNPWTQHYDGIIANPPYYKHHFIENKETICSEVSKNTNHKFSPQTNIYCWFLIKSMNLLKEDGRLAFIIPTEFLNSNYGVQVKEYLKNSGIVLHLINVDFTENVFDNALTTSVIVLAHKQKTESKHVNFYTVSKVEELNNLDSFIRNHSKKTYQISDLNPKEKWRNYFNGNHGKYTKKNLIPFSTYGRFSRGIATGANSYFTLSYEEVNKYKPPKQSLIPCITKANHVKSIVFNQNDFNNLYKLNKKVFLFDGEKAPENKYSKKYIKLGEKQNIHKRYLTKKRDPWYSLEKREKSFIWASVFGRSGLKFIWNNTNCLNLTCFHAFYPTMFGEKYLKILFLYLNTKIAKQLLDLEKREYGNGLEKYEPNDINKSFSLNMDRLENNQIETLSKLQKELISNPSNSKIVEKADAVFKSIY